eukprot:GDKK01071037.1.p1 GENE.GDKK01071037.1~~GDKK01071037.1.p1  ORF type:complete len:484 (-),score=38.50 GDKK01071037.1:38-1489(-)
MNNESPENQPPVTNDNDAPTLASAVTTTEVAPSPPEQVLLPCLCCDFCDNVLCTRADILSDQAATFSDQVYTYQLDILEEMFPVYSATNPATVRFDVARVSSSTVDRRHIVCEPRYSPQHSWFPPYEWSMASCGSCGAHLGWGFAARDDAKANEQLESHKKSLVAALTELAENDHRKSKSQSKSRGESEVPATSTGAKRSRSRSVESSGANNNESRQVTDNAENDDADDDDRFETAESHSVDGEEAEDEEDWADCDEEVEEEDEEETDPEAEKIGLLADVDPTLHKYWSKLPEVLRQAPKTKGHSPLAFVGLIVTRCRAKESASAEYVNENIAGAVNREYENLRFHSIVRQIFQLLNSVPQNLRGMANSIGMLVLQIRQSYHSRGGIEAVLAEAQGLSDISTQLARLAQSDGGQALVDHLIRVDAPASPEARAQQIRDFSAHAREGRQQVPQPESVPEDEAEPEGSAPTETNNAETEPRSHSE